MAINPKLQQALIAAKSATKQLAKPKAGGGEVDRDANLAHFMEGSHHATLNGDGSPKVFYTGTSKDKDFSSFNVGRHGVWLTSDPEIASQYATQNDSMGYRYDGSRFTDTNTASRVMPVHIHVKNPFTGHLPDEIKHISNYKKAQSDWFDTLRAKGHDAWIPQGGNVVAVLGHPGQIKSAIGNNGNFNPTKKSMTESQGGYIEKAGGGEVDNESPAPIKLSGPNPKVKNWVDKMYGFYPEWPFGGDKSFVIPHETNDQGQIQKWTQVSMTPHGKRAHISWVSAYPQKEGVGRAGMQKLMDSAAEHGVGLTLSPWDKGQVPASKLHKFYKSLGFEGPRGGSLTWDPPAKEIDESNDDRTAKAGGGSLFFDPDNPVGAQIGQDPHQKMLSKLQGPQIVKDPGGNFLSGSVENAVSSLRKKFFVAHSPEVFPRWKSPEDAIDILNKKIQDYPESADQYQRQLPKAKQTKSVNDFLTKQLTRYIKNEMGTEKDPIRELAERGISHAPDDILNSNVDSIDRFRRSAKTIYPNTQSMAKSDLAKKWENLTDRSLIPINREDALTNLKDIEKEIGNYGGNSWLSKVDPKTPIYGQYLNPTYAFGHRFSDLGFTHLVDELQNSVNPESDLPDHLKFRHESLARMSVPQAVQHVHNINEWRRKNREEANKEKAFNSATFLHKDYPDSNYAWHELRLPESDKDGKEKLDEALNYEGSVMGHCVGGYTDSVASGKKRIFSLRNKKTGEPHVTIETGPKSLNYSDLLDHLGGDEDLANDYLAQGVQARQNANNDNNLSATNDNNLSPLGHALNLAGVPRTQSIEQIKGKGNARPTDRYLPYVHDFVKSGRWGSVKDLQNTNLQAIHPESELAQKLKNMGEPVPQYVDDNELSTLTKKTNTGSYSNNVVDHLATGGAVGNGFKRGGKPEDVINDWNWRPMSEVHSDLGNIAEIPSHVRDFGKFMDDTANKAGTQGLSPRDLIKAFTITRASIQRQAVDADKVRNAGLHLPSDVGGKIRPEGAFGEWLHSSMGQRYLDHAQKGHVDPTSIQNAVQIMAPFGRHTTDIPNALTWAAKNLPGRESAVSRLVAAAQQGESSPSEWRDYVKDIKGIGPSKAGFVASLLGRGDQPTLDARQLILHTGQPSKEAAKYLARRGGLGAQQAVDRLADRQSSMNLAIPDNLKPYYQHLAHHTVWDKAANEQTTHSDVMNAMQHAANGGAIEANPLINHPVFKGMQAAGLPLYNMDPLHHTLPDKTIHKTIDPKKSIQKAMMAAQSIGYAKGGSAKKPKNNPVVEKKPLTDAQIYEAWTKIPTINPQDLVGKTIVPIRADLLHTGSDYTGIDSSQTDVPVPMRGGPGFPFIPENSENKVGWASKGKGSANQALVGKNADYAVVSAMMPDTHESNGSFARALIETNLAHVRDGRISPENVEALNELIRNVGDTKVNKKGKITTPFAMLKKFPGMAHPDVHSFMDNLSFDARNRISGVLKSAKAEKLGVANFQKISRATTDPRFAGLNRADVMYLLRIDPNAPPVDWESEGITPHDAYPIGLRGQIVGKFHHSFNAEQLWPKYFKDKLRDKIKKNEKRIAEGKEPYSLDQLKTQVYRAFDLGLPKTKVTQAIADNLPAHPQDIQSPQAARIALDVAHDRWINTDSPVNAGGVSPADMSRALRSSDASSTLTPYSEKEIKSMVRKKQFRGFKLPSGDVYFGLKKGTNYAEDYGFEHPDLTPNETSLVSVANNEPGAKGIGGPSIMLKAIQEGATALDAFAVPSEKHPNGFLPSYYSNFGFHELGRIPFEPSYYSPTQVEDMKHYWRSTGWDESMGLPHVAIMKWKGNESDRQNALQNYLTQSSANSGPSDDRSDVRSASGLAQYGSDENSGQAPVSPLSNGQGDRGGLRNDSSPRPADRFARTLASTLNLNPNQAFAFGLNHEDISAAKEKMPFLANPQSLPKTPKKAQGGPLTHFNGVNSQTEIAQPPAKAKGNDIVDQAMQLVAKLRRHNPPGRR